jgi:hypothetical protein
MPNRNPDHGDRENGSPDTGAPETGSPETGSPDTGAPETGSPETGSPENGSPETGAPDSVNVRSKDYLIARTVRPCAHCGARTTLVALVLPPSHETLSLAEGDEELPDSWDEIPASAFLFYVGYLPDGVRQRMQASSKTYRPAVSPAAPGSYWANHCEHCGSLQEDQDLFCEPEGAFLPVDAASASAIELTRIDEPFAAAAAGYACEPEYLEHMVRT